MANMKYNNSFMLSSKNIKDFYKKKYYEIWINFKLCQNKYMYNFLKIVKDLLLSMDFK